jgi:hypothetical protein
MNSEFSIDAGIRMPAYDFAGASHNIDKRISHWLFSRSLSASAILARSNDFALTLR